MKFAVTETAVLPAAPAAVFGLITDIARLPEWNKEIGEIHERPQALEAGAQWVLEIHAMGSHWRSRSTVVDYDPTQRVFAYRSQSDDGNPSFADWEWRVTPHAKGAEVRVNATVNPETFWRRYLLSSLRKGSLRKAVRASLDRLGEAAAAS